MLDANVDHLVNGSFFPDSGYAAEDSYGELAHWEQFVESYIRWIRATYAPPFAEGEAAKHVALLLGAASHGMVDQTFDILFMDRAGEIDGDTEELDTAMDVMLVPERNRHLVPTLVHDGNLMAKLFGGALIAHEVTPATVDKGITLARAALGFVVTVLSKRHEEYRTRFPWAGAHYLDRNMPGGYPRSAKIVARYWESILRRLDGMAPVDDVDRGEQSAAGRADDRARSPRRRFPPHAVHGHRNQARVGHPR